MVLKLAVRLEPERHCEYMISNCPRKSHKNISTLISFWILDSLINNLFKLTLFNVHRRTGDYEVTSYQAVEATLRRPSALSYHDREWQAIFFSRIPHVINREPQSRCFMYILCLKGVFLYLCFVSALEEWKCGCDKVNGCSPFCFIDMPTTHASDVHLRGDGSFTLMHTAPRSG